MHTPSHTNVCKFYIFSADISPELLKLDRVTKVKVLFLVLVYIFNFDFFEFSAAILEKGLLLSPGGPLREQYFSPEMLFLKSKLRYGNEGSLIIQAYERYGSCSPSLD